MRRALREARLVTLLLERPQFLYGGSDHGVPCSGGWRSVGVLPVQLACLQRKRFHTIMQADVHV